MAEKSECHKENAKIVNSFVHFHKHTVPSGTLAKVANTAAF